MHVSRQKGSRSIISDPLGIFRSRVTCSTFFGFPLSPKHSIPIRLFQAALYVNIFNAKVRGRPKPRCQKEQGELTIHTFDMAVGGQFQVKNHIYFQAKCGGSIISDPFGIFRSRVTCTFFGLPLSPKPSIASRHFQAALYVNEYL